jgi:hypothetical protein
MCRCQAGTCHRDIPKVRATQTTARGTLRHCKDLKWCTFERMWKWLWLILRLLKFIWRESGKPWNFQLWKCVSKRTNWSWDEYESWLSTIQSQRHTINLKVDFLFHVRQLYSPHLHHHLPQHGYHENHIRTLRHRKWRLSDWHSCLLFWRFRVRFPAESRISQVNSWLYSVTPD